MSRFAGIYKFINSYISPTILYTCLPTRKEVCDSEIKINRLIGFVNLVFTCIGASKGNYILFLERKCSVVSIVMLKVPRS